MRVLLAPDKFRGTFTAAQVCAHVSRGLAEASRTLVVESIPLADGGEGTLEAVLDACGGTRFSLRARGPLDSEITADYGVTPEGIAVIEAAKLCGLDLVPEQKRDPMRASSYGLGEAVAAALDAGLSRFLIGLGGTATMDGGVGMAQALGYRFEDSAGIKTDGRGGDLARIARIDSSMVHSDLARARFTALHDVSHRLLGPFGAAPIFGPQKGASLQEVARIEEGLTALAAAIGAWKGIDPSEVAAISGGGAAGGLGVGCMAFLGARLTPGATCLMELLGFPERLMEADLVITGEGSLEDQTSGGKVVAAVLSAAARAAKPAIIVAGRWDGTLPEPRPQTVKVLTGQDLPGRPRILWEDELSELGREIARWAAKNLDLSAEH